MSKKFVRNVMKLLPGYRHVGNIFYVSQVSDMIFGYAYERRSTGVQCYLYNFPLFLRSKILHLDYSLRIPHPRGEIPITNAMEKKFLGIERKYSSLDDQQVASEFVHICREFKDAKFPYEESLDGFIRWITEQSQSDYDGPYPALRIDNSRRLYLLAAALALEGNRNLAVAHLEMIFDKTVFDQRTDRQTQAYSIDDGGAKGEMKIVPLHEGLVIKEPREDSLLSDARYLYELLQKDGAEAVEWLKAIEETNRAAFKLN
jgi:hypothetical protein